ncbi:hypothetical protein C8A00DRAFT_17315, partial [Chaetomidium leptoderma]
VVVRSHRSWLIWQCRAMTAYALLFLRNCPAPGLQTGQGAARRRGLDSAFVDRLMERRSTTRPAVWVGCLISTARCSQEGAPFLTTRVELYVPLFCMLSEVVDRGERSTRLERRRTSPPPSHFTKAPRYVCIEGTFVQSGRCGRIEGVRTGGRSPGTAASVAMQSAGGDRMRGWLAVFSCLDSAKMTRITWASSFPCVASGTRSHTGPSVRTESPSPRAGSETCHAIVGSKVRVPS